MSTARGLLLALVVAAGCGTRGGFAEPGPTSASAYPPGPPSVVTGEPLQPSPGDGRPSAIPPAVGPTGNNIPAAPDAEPQSCTNDSDCVPAECCHPTACTAHANAPVCTNIVCTEHCAAGTLDCGQAHCVCLGGRCGVQRRG